MVLPHTANRPSALPRRVLFLARHLDSGGVTTHMKTLAKGLQQHGIEVAVASRGQVQEHMHGPAWFEQDGISHFEIPFPRPVFSVRNVYDALRAAAVLDRAVRPFRPDLLHVHWRAVSPYAQLVWLARRIPFVSTLHLTNIPTGPLYRFGSFWGAYAIGISQAATSYLHDAFGVPAHRTRRIAHGLDATYFRPPASEERAQARRRFGLAPDVPTIAFIGTLDPRKGHAVFLHALARVHAGGIEAAALLAGAGDPVPIRQQAARLNLIDQVHLLGHTDPRAVLWAADVLVLPSYREGFALAVAEAMLCGVVPIRTPGGGSDEQIREGVTGFLVPPDDVEALARTLADVLTNPSLRHRVGREAYNHAHERFGLERMVEATLAVYRDALTPSASSRGRVG